ncbi:flagellar hook-length control protein [Mycobacterium sp. SMC-8]|uniref:flagellar hook-length control protein n=1 Tax=Mycobacterium sp. SMC-8 TaxID=2857060 RepID=UPI0021B1C322|nr:flagellar hook-length control protein [Mycobacterium sp. SMC-8]UXA10756.1 flagellar hook-length control protein [Mycobacterium sp. SMC-8]
MTTTEDVIKSAAAVARDAAEGRLSSADLDQAVADECRALFGVVAGPDDPLWPLHVDIARQVLAAGGLTAAEVAEWAAVLKRREQHNGAVGTVDGSQPRGGPDVPADPETSASGSLSPGSGGPDAHPETGL